MSFPTPDEVNRIRAYQLIVQLERDPALAARAKENPRSALTEAGVPEETIDELLGIEAAEPANDDGMQVCTDTTCWTSDCPGTCYLTTITVELDDVI